MSTAAKGVGAVLDPVTTATVLGTKALGSALSPKIPNINIPAIPGPTPMPIPGADDMSTILARRASISAQLARRGRLSTILSQPQSEPLGA